MQLWLIILISAVGGFLLLVFMTLTIWMLCRKRKRSKLPILNEGQNGKVWQSHDHIIDVNDEESPTKRLHEDGLCKDTISGSTFPRRGKKEEEKSEPEEDGLCKETRIRSSTIPSRGKLEESWIKPVENGGSSVSANSRKSALPVGAPATTIVRKETDKDPPKPKKELQHTATVHTAAVDVTIKEQSFDDNGPSSEKNTMFKEYNTNHVRRFKNKRSKSFHGDLDDIPVYSKPIKRAVSNPSLIAKEKMLKEDRRFESLDSWKESAFPLPEPDYPQDSHYISMSNATSDSGVEIPESVSGHDDDSETRSESIPESPGIQMPQMENQDTEQGSFLLKELRSINNVETREHKNFITENNDFKVAINDRRTPVSTFPKETTMNSQDKVAVNNLKNTTSGQPVAMKSQVVLNHKITKVTTENKQAASSSSANAQPVGFISTNLEPAAIKEDHTNQDQVHFTTPRSADSDAKKLLPSSLVRGNYPSNQDKPHAVNSTSSMSPSNITKKTVTNYQTTVNRSNHSEPTLNNQIDFRAFKLRPTPDSIKQNIGFKEDLQLSQIQSENIHKDSNDAEKRAKGESLSNSNPDQGPRLPNLSMPANSEVKEKTNLNQNPSIKTNGTIGNSNQITNSNKTLNEKQKPTPDSSAAPSNETTPKSPRRHTSGGFQSEEERRKNWRREQIEQRLSTGLALSERQPIMQASGLAYRNCMPELFTKIKKIGDQKEDVTVN